jgi:protein ImuB
MTLFCAIYVPDFAAAAVLRNQPELRGRPLAILQGTPPLLRVMGMNEAARQEGIEAGMTKIQAEALAGLALRRRSLAQEDAAHAALLDCAYAFSPRVEPLLPDTVLLDITGLERLFGPPAAVAQALSLRTSQQGLECNIAVAANREAAVHAALGFTGITVIPPGEEAKRLGPLPVDVLFNGLQTCLQEKRPDLLDSKYRPDKNARQNQKDRPHRKNDETDPAQRFLDKCGVHTLRAFAALPTVAVAERLGQQGVRLQKLAQGIGSQSLVAAEPPLHFEEALELEYPVDLLEPLAFILSRLLEQLCARLEWRTLSTNELRLTLQLDAPAEQFVRRTLRLPVPMRDAKIFLKLLQLDLKSHPPAAPVIKVAIAAEPVRPQVTQHGLFTPQGPEPEKLQLMLARIAGVVGEANLGSPEVLDTHRPGAFAMRPFEGQVSRPQDSRKKARSEKSAKPRSGDEMPTLAGTHPHMALRLFRPPLRATVDLREGRPVRLAFSPHEQTRGRPQPVRGDIVWAAGPWRTSGEWWDGKEISSFTFHVSSAEQRAAAAEGKQKSEAGNSAWAHDEWDIAVANEIADGPQARRALVFYRLVHDIAKQEWFVEGAYD